MAVDYLHRIVVEGPRKRVRAIRHQMYRAYPRSVGGERWMEVVPFSFKALYELAPSVRRIEREIPNDPYELRSWPVRRIGERRAEVRYQFQTRNLEMAALIRALSRAVPSLTFTLMTFCFDDSSIESCLVSRGTMRKWVLREDRQEFHWERARKKFHLEGDDVYDDDGAEFWVEEEMRNEGVHHWDRADGRGRRRYKWWNREPSRDLDTERELALYEVAETLNRKSRAAKQGPKTDRRRTRNRRRIKR